MDDTTINGLRQLILGNYIVNKVGWSIDFEESDISPRIARPDIWNNFWKYRGKYAHFYSIV